MRLAPRFTHGLKIVEYVSSYVHLGVVFTRPMFFFLFFKRGGPGATARLTQGHVALGTLERMCSHV